MNTMIKRGRMYAVFMALVVILFLTLGSAGLKAESTAKKLWLSHFVGDEVIVTFISIPPNMSRSVKAKLMDAESPGIVLKFGKQEIFFSYANIISVEPAPK